MPDTPATDRDPASPIPRLCGTCGLWPCHAHCPEAMEATTPGDERYHERITATIRTGIKEHRRPEVIAHAVLNIVDPVAP